MDTAASWHGGSLRTCTHTYTQTGCLISKYYLRGTGTQAGTSGTPVQSAAHALTCDNLAKSAVFANLFEVSLIYAHVHTNANTYTKANPPTPTHQRSLQQRSKAAETGLIP